MPPSALPAPPSPASPTTWPRSTGRSCTTSPRATPAPRSCSCTGGRRPGGPSASVIPLLARTHRVFAVDLRGFGDSSHADASYDAATSAEDLHQLVGQLGVGPVHLLCQDISGGLGFRFAATHPATSAASPRSRPPWSASGWRCWPTSTTADPGTSDSSAHQAFPRCCWPATSASSSPTGPTRCSPRCRAPSRRRTSTSSPARTRAPTAGAALPVSTSPSSPTAAQTQALAEARPLAVPVLTVDAFSAASPNGRSGRWPRARSPRCDLRESVTSWRRRPPRRSGGRRPSFPGPGGQRLRSRPR